VGPILYRLGRMLQLIGLLMLPLAIAGNLSPNDPMTLGQSLTFSAIGIGVFMLGYWLQQAGKPEG
jgi:hypothetical protein